RTLGVERGVAMPNAIELSWDSRPSAPVNSELRRISEDVATAAVRSQVAALKQQGRPPLGSADAAFSEWLARLPTPKFQKLRSAAEAMEGAGQAHFGRFHARPMSELGDKGFVRVVHESPLEVDLAAFSVDVDVDDSSGWSPNREVQATRRFVNALGVKAYQSHRDEFRHDSAIAVSVGTGPIGYSRIELTIHRIKCVDETGTGLELGRDEINLGGCAVGPDGESVA